MPLATFSRFENDNGQKPSAVLVFGEHARELITCEVGLWLSRVLINDTAELFSWEEWRTAFAPLGIAPDAVPATVHGWVKRILDNLVIKLLPIENVDGRQAWEAGSLCLRKTARGVDLNRNYPFNFANEDRSSEMYGGPHPFSEPQSRMIARLALEGGRPAKAYINVHSGEWAVYSGWDSKAAVGPGLPADLEDLLLKSGQLCNCQAGPAGAVSNYLAYGTGMDFMYTQLGVPYALTYEVFGDSGLLGDPVSGAKNKPLFAFPYEVDNRIATTLPNIDSLLPPVSAHQHTINQHQHHHKEHQRAHAAAARVRRAAWEAGSSAQAGLGGHEVEVEGAGVDAGVEGRGGQRGRRRRRRAAGVRRMFARRDPGPEAQILVEEQQQFGEAGMTRLGANKGLDDGSGVSLAELGRFAREVAAGGFGSRRLRATAGGGTGAVGEEVDPHLGMNSEQPLPLRSLGGRSMRRLAAAAEEEEDGPLAAGGLAGDDAAGMMADEGSAEQGAAGGQRVLLNAADISSFSGPDGPILAMVRSRPRFQQSCFDMFNPPLGQPYRAAVSRWVAILLMTLDHVADPGNPKPSPHPLPGTVLAGAGAGAATGGRHLLQVEAGGHKQQQQEPQALAGAGVGAVGRSLLGGEGDEEERRQQHHRHHQYHQHHHQSEHVAEAEVKEAGAGLTDEALLQAGATRGGSAAGAAAVGVASAGAGAEGTSGYHTDGRAHRHPGDGAGAGGMGAAAGGVEDGRRQYGSSDFDHRVRQRVYEVDPVMRQHSLVVLVALVCLAVVFVPWWMVVMRRPGLRRSASTAAAAKRARPAAAW